MLADSSARERTAFAAVLLPLLGCLAWTMLWYLLHGASVVQALLSPWAAPIALLRWPDGMPVAPQLSWSGIAALAMTTGLAAAMFAPRPRPLHGDARFATRAEIRKMKLLSDGGVLLGQLGGLFPGFLRHEGPLHILLTAPTRSGKGVGVVTPNLLSWPGSVVVLDVKNENFQTTSGFRARCGQKVYRFAPGDPDRRTHRYNPLDAVRRDRAHRIADLQAVAHLLTPEAAGEQKMWNQEARSLFVGLCLYILDTQGLALTFGQVARILQTNADLREALLAVIRERGDKLDPACVNILSNFIQKAPKERSGVKSTLTGALELWNDPAIDAATSASDFSFDDLRRTPTTVYVSVSLDQLERVAFLLNIVFQQLIGVTSRRPPCVDEPHPVLVLIDEFASLGRMDLIVDKMPFLAGFNVKLMLVIQGLAQLDRLYGVSGRELVLQNSGLQIYFASNDEQTSSHVSSRLGTTTVRHVARSRSRPVMGGGHGSVSHATHVHARPLMTPDEVRRLDARQALIFVEGGRPLRAAKIVYHADPAFAARAAPPLPVEPIAAPVHPPFRFDRAEQLHREQCEADNKGTGPQPAKAEAGTQGAAPAAVPRQPDAAPTDASTASPPDPVRPEDAEQAGPAATVAPRRSRRKTPPAPHGQTDMFNDDGGVPPAEQAELKRLHAEIPAMQPRRGRQSLTALYDEDRDVGR